MVTRSIAGRITQALLSNDERAEARSSDWLWREIFESLRGENCPHPGNRTERKEAGPSCTILDPQVKLYQTYRLVHSYHSLLHYHPNTFGSGGFGHERWCFLPWLSMTDIQTMNSLRDVRWCTIHIYSEFIWDLGELDIIVSVSPFDFLWHVSQQRDFPALHFSWRADVPRGRDEVNSLCLRNPWWKRVAMAEVSIIFGSLCLGVATQSLGMSQHVSTIVIRWVWTSTALMVRQKIAPARSGTATMMRFQLGWRGRLDGFKDHPRILGTIKNCP